MLCEVYKFLEKIFFVQKKQEINLHGTTILLDVQLAHLAHLS